MIGLGISLWQAVIGGESGPRALALLSGETDGLAIDFTDMSMEVKDTATPANIYSGIPQGKLTYTSPSTKWIRNGSGVLVSGTTLRTEYSSAGLALGVRLEEQRTNLALYSTDLTNMLWFGSISITGGVSDPAGGTSAFKLSAYSGQFFQSFGGGATGSNSCSIFLKYENWQYYALQCQCTGTYSRTIFDIQNGTMHSIGNGAETHITSTIEPYGNGWYRVTVSATLSGAFTHITLSAATSTSDFTIPASKSVNMFWPQAEAGAFATSPIPTVGSSVTRAADNLSFATTLFPYSTSAGTAFVKLSRFGFNNAASPVAIGIASAGRWIYFGASGEIRTYDGTSILDAAASSTVNTEYRIAMAAGSSTESMVYNGGTVVSGAFDNTMGTGSLYFGSGNYVNSNINGHIKQIMHLPRKMSNAEIQARTA